MKKNLSQAERVRFLRSLTGLHAKDFCERYGLSLSSFSKWEAGFNPLSITSANRLVAIAAENGIICHLSWILHGKGEEAKVLTEESKISINKSTSHKLEVSTSFHTFENELMAVSREIELLRTVHHAVEVMSITDDSMTPQFKIGDYVGGLPIDITLVKKYLDFPCIIETEDKKKRLRRIGYNNKQFFLFGTNTGYKGGSLFELSPHFLKISPVFWHRMHGVINEHATTSGHRQAG